jgi:DNA-binding CsgD family transcriptional regulator
VFTGGFDLDAAERVCAGEPLAAGPIFDTLGRLVEKSIVLCEQDGRRYRMLDTIREYGAEHLALLGEQDELRRRHRDYYLGLAEQAAACSLGPGQVGWLVRLRQETPNLRVALDHSYFRPGQEAGVLTLQQGDLEQAEPLLARAADLAQELHDRDLRAHVTDAQAIASFFAGDLQTAGARHENALAEYAEIGFSDPFALVTFTRLAAVCCLTGELDRAIALSEECLRISEELGEQWARGTALWTRGAARWLSGDVAHAVEDTLACLRIKESLGDLHTTTMAIDLLAVCLVAQEDFARAAELCGAGDAFWKMLRAPIQQGPYYAEIRRSAAETCRQALGDERFESYRQRGLELSVAEAIAVARNEVPVPADEISADPLTRREREIAELVTRGLGNREIAERLVLAKRTVDSHIEHIFSKLGFTSRTQLAAWVSRQNAN